MPVPAPCPVRWCAADHHPVGHDHTPGRHRAEGVGVLMEPDLRIPRHHPEHVPGGSLIERLDRAARRAFA